MYRYLVKRTIKHFNDSFLDGVVMLFVYLSIVVWLPLLLLLDFFEITPEKVKRTDFECVNIYSHRYNLLILFSILIVFCLFCFVIDKILNGLE
ncbi:hypothetical protein GCM10022393_27650 [Aquimarina addita]|uniref:G-protein coupled receptors family 1 profile domain-containing protein n=1 Tax=Aquimarina addita TaxID=870485 RepID=A0ABP6UPD3_9FLAO